MKRNRHQHFLHFGIALGQIVRVVGGYGLYAVVFCHAYQKRQNALLICDIVILYLDIKIVAENFLKPLDP